MEFFRRYKKQMGCYFFLMPIIFCAAGCNYTGSSPYDGVIQTQTVSDELEWQKSWKPAYELEEDMLVSHKGLTETETTSYFVMEKQSETGKSYPQIRMKAGADLLCGEDFLNELLENHVKGNLSVDSYEILYSDEHMLCLCFWGNMDEGKVPEPMVLNLENINYASSGEGNIWLQSIQDDNLAPETPWSGNGIVFSLDELWAEIENGNCYLDRNAYELWQQNPQDFIESVQEYFNQMQEETFYFAEQMYSFPYRMYLTEGRVGFYIFDFNIEIAYDWKRNALPYQTDYQIYRERYDTAGWKDVCYPQIRGVGEQEKILNENMRQDLLCNLESISIEKTNEIMVEYGWENYWRQYPRIGPPRVIYQSEKYVCIRQEPLLDVADGLRFAEGWKRYHVYDLETGESLGLGDMVLLDEGFLKWLKEGKCMDVYTEFNEGMDDEWPKEYMKASLEDYSIELLETVLNDAEIWLKDERLYIRIPYLDKYGKILKMGGGTGFPNYIYYAECGISTKDLESFLLRQIW